MTTLIILCVQVADTMGDKLFFLFLGSALTVIGSWAITQYTFYKNKKRDSDIAIAESRANIIATCHRLARIFNMMEINGSISKLAGILYVKTNDQNNFSLAMNFENTANNQSLLLEEKKSELHKHIVYYFHYCNQADRDFLNARRGVVDRAETRSFNEYDSIGSINELREKINTSRITIPAENISKSPVKELDEIILYLNPT